MMTLMIDDVLEHVLRAEGGYVNDPNDAGGETNHGITIAVARANGFAGPMRDLPRSLALAIYRKRYVDDPGFAKVAAICPSIGAELVDTGVNMGPATAAMFLQRALNGLNRGGKDYPDIAADGRVGPGTLAALKAYRDRRGSEGERRLLILLNALQGARYLALAEGRAANESFLYGWLDRAA
jgi:lysozyme family protein